MEGWCDEGGAAEATLRIKKGIANGVYTTFDIGVTNPLKDTESLSAGPRSLSLPCSGSAYRVLGNFSVIYFRTLHLEERELMNR